VFFLHAGSSVAQQVPEGLPANAQVGQPRPTDRRRSRASNAPPPSALLARETASESANWCVANGTRCFAFRASSSCASASVVIGPRARAVFRRVPSCRRAGSRCR
jgi:hypothetical protein